MAVCPFPVDEAGFTPGGVAALPGDNPDIVADTVYEDNYKGGGATNRALGWEWDGYMELEKTNGACVRQ